jgi:tryptophan-rich sensory protein
MREVIVALIACAVVAAIETLCAGKDPMGKLRRLRQPAGSPPTWVWILIGVSWYALSVTALVRLQRAEEGVGGLFDGLVVVMLINAAANIPQFRMQRLDIAFFYLFPYWIVLAAFLRAAWPADRFVVWMFAPYAVYQVYAAVWAWKLWKLNASEMPR